MATVATDNMPSAIRPNLAARQLSTTSGDYDLSYTSDVRKTLGTYGLTPPAVESYDIQSERCKSIDAHWSTVTDLTKASGSLP